MPTPSARALFYRRALILAALAAFAALPVLSQEVVDVKLTQPPPNQLRVADFWKVELNNRSGKPVRIMLHGTAEETSIPDGIIADVDTKIFEIPPGRSVVTGSMVQPIHVNESNKTYEDALLRTGLMPTGEYTLCVEALSAESEQVIGRDCKFVTINRLTIPILIAPPDESEVMDRLPVFSWMPSVPPSPQQRMTYRLKIVEVFANQTPFDAMQRNPAFMMVESLNRTVFQYPVSSRTFEVKHKYAWMVSSIENATRLPVVLGESEIWWFTYLPMEVPKDDDAGAKTTAAGGTFFPVTPSCPGENWDFEVGTMACWIVSGDAMYAQPQRGSHPVFGNLGHHLDWWVTTFAPGLGEAALGQAVSEEFQLKNTTVSFLFGGANDRSCAVEFLVEKQSKDTLKLETRKVPGIEREYYVAFSTGRAEDRTKKSSTSDRLVAFEWDLTKYVNRSARVLIIDQSKLAHVNVDKFLFFDAERKDTVKLPVMIMAAGERHSLAVTPEEKPPVKTRTQFATDVTALKDKRVSLSDGVMITDMSVTTKGRSLTATKATIAAPPNTENESNLDLMTLTMAPEYTQAISKFALTALNVKNTLWGWGSNDEKRVQKAAPSVVPEPVHIDIKELNSIAAGMAHSIANTKDGKVQAWGSNDYGQLGTNDYADHADPSAVNLLNCIQVSTGMRNAAAITKNGELYTWGYNRSGEAGLLWTFVLNPTTGQVASVWHPNDPVKNTLFKEPMVQVSCGAAHSAAVGKSGLVYLWGNNSYGQIGVDPDVAYMPVPVQLSGGGVSTIKDARLRAKSVSCGDFHTMILDMQGRVYTLGGNASGQLGDGTTKDSYKPVYVAGLPTSIRAISAGSTFSLAVDSLGNVWAWGNNVLGTLGDGTRICRYVPTKVGRIDGVQGIEGGGAHALAVRTDGSLWTWGDNAYGQLGDGSTANMTTSLVDPPLGPTRVEKLAAP